MISSSNKLYALCVKVFPREYWIILHQKSILGLKVFTPFKVARVCSREYSSSDELSLNIDDPNMIFKQRIC